MAPEEGENFPHPPGSPRRITVIYSASSNAETFGWGLLSLSLGLWLWESVGYGRRSSGEHLARFMEAY